MRQLPVTWEQRSSAPAAVRSARRTELVGQHGRDLVLGALFDQGVVQDNALVAEEPVHVRIGVAASLGTVDLVQLLQRKSQTRCQGLNPISERPLLRAPGRSAQPEGREP